MPWLFARFACLALAIYHVSSLLPGIPFEFEAVSTTLDSSVDAPSMLSASVQGAATGLIEGSPVLILLLSRAGNRMSFAAAEDVKRKVQSAKLYLKLGTCSAISEKRNIRRGDAAVVGGPADVTCLFDLDEDFEYSVTSPGYCHDLLLWVAETQGLDPIRIHRLPMFSKSVKFTPLSFPRTVRPACGDMEAAGVWDSVARSGNDGLRFGSVNIITEIFFEDGSVEKFHDQRAKIALLNPALPRVLKNLITFLKRRMDLAQ